MLLCFCFLVVVFKTSSSTLIYILHHFLQPTELYYVACHFFVACHFLHPTVLLYTPTSYISYILLLERQTKTTDYLKSDPEVDCENIQDVQQKQQQRKLFVCLLVDQIRFLNMVFIYVTW